MIPWLEAASTKAPEGLDIPQALFFCFSPNLAPPNRDGGMMESRADRYGNSSHKWNAASRPSG